MDPLTGMRSWDHCGLHDGTPLPYAQYITINRLEPVSGQSYGTPPTGLQCDLSAVDKAVLLSISWLPRVLPHVEWIVIAIQQTALGGQHKYP